MLSFLRMEKCSHALEQETKNPLQVIPLSYWFVIPVLFKQHSVQPSERYKIL